MCKSVLGTLVIVLVLAGLSLAPATAEDSPEEIIKTAHACVAGHSVELRQTVEQTSRLLFPGQPPVEIPTTKQTSVIEIDTANRLIRMTTKDGGKEVVVIRKEKDLAMKTGAGPWTKPTGPYARMAAQLANPFACPLPTAGDRQSPKWRIVDHELLDGRKTTVIETIGNTANKFALERMREGLVAAFPDRAARPTIEVLSYKSRHWIGKDDQHPLRVEQTSHEKMTMPGADKIIIDMTMKTTTVYRRYDHVQIKVPEEARRILTDSVTPEKTGRR
jgi:hypothetical protein